MWPFDVASGVYSISYIYFSLEHKIPSALQLLVNVVHKACIVMPPLNLVA